MVASGQTRFFDVECPLDGTVQRQNAGFLAPGQTKVGVNIDNVANTSGVTVPLPTPPAGKAWIITDFSMTHTETTPVSLRFAFTVGGVAVWSSLIHQAAPDFITALETQIDVPQGQAPAVVIASGGAGGVAYANFYGMYQNVGVG